MSLVQMNPIIWNSRKSAQAMDPRVQQLDDLQRLSEEARNKFIGEDWYKTADDLYNFTVSGDVRPSFRPTVNIPQLQVMMLNKATDISALRPKVYIFSGNDRQKERKKAFQDHWRHAQFNYQILLAQLASLFEGTDYVQIGFDPWANRGKGNVWIRRRRAKSVYPDPASISHYNWAYVQWEDRMYIDNVRRMYHRPDLKLRGRPSAPASYSNASLLGEGSHGFGLPPGPLSAGPTFMRKNTQRTMAL